MAKGMIGMTPEDIAAFIKTNSEQLSTIMPCVLGKQGDYWILSIGGTRPDGEFRAVDFELDAGVVDVAVSALQKSIQ